MPFLSNDHYLTSGTSQLINAWTDPVYKFDSSSFYNWEQDNLPIYDLEERDDFLYEMAGYPLSSVTGMSLCVSDCGIDNKKVFGTISDAIDALPNTIRFPIIIEVAASGNLGELRLEDKVFEGAGAGLEIINRGFAKALCGSGTPVSNAEFVGTDGSPLVVSAVVTVSSPDINSTMEDSSAICVSTTVWDKSTVEDYWGKNHVRAFFITPEWSNENSGGNRTQSMSTYFQDSGDGTNFSGGSNLYDCGTATTDPIIYMDNSVSSDIAIYNNTNTPVTQTYRDGIVAGDYTRVTGLIYANSLSAVFIKNCVGPVYVRGFCVDGGSEADLKDSLATQITAKGFDIQNSDVVIENCTATRCTHAGLEAVNSTVILNRGFIAFRNYELSDGIGGTNLDTKVVTNETPGLRAINSNVVLSSTTASDTGLPIDSPYCFNRNMVGIELENSKLGTSPGFQYGKNAAGADPEEASNKGSQTLVLQTFLNMKEGIKATNSLIDTSQRIASFANETGVRLVDSVLNVGQFTFDHNQLAGVDATNSTFNYNKDGITTDFTADSFYPVYNFQANGQDIVLKGSTFIPTYVDGMDAVYEDQTFSLSGNHQCEERRNGAGKMKSTLPSVVLKDGSYMDGIGVKSINATFENDTEKYEVAEGIRGAAFSVTDQSTLRLVGHQYNATYILGPEKWSKQQRVAGVYAGNNSKVYFAGPTTIAQFGIDALAEDNSVIEFGPPLKDGVLDVSGFNLADTNNHTRVQLHSTRACLVANRNSTIDMHDLGDYHAYWDPKYYTTAGGVTLEPLDYPTGDGTAAGAGQNMYATSAYTSSGAMQFYPNPFADYVANGATNGVGVINQATYPQSPFNNVPTTQNKWVKLTAESTDVSNASWGGMCVRAVGGSKVNVRNVMFPTGWAEPSGAYYDASTVGQCDLLRIWNIADESQLHTSYLSVSDLHPQDTSATYTGPSAVWVSGASPSYVPLSGAPSSTPNTDKLSVLDSFGLGYDHAGALGFYGKTTFENIGPFRIYVSPHPKAKFLGYPYSPVFGCYTPYGPGGTGAFFSMGYEMSNQSSFILSGVPYQLFAQGYATSSDCSAINDQGPNYTNTSAIYQDLGFSSYMENHPQLNMPGGTGPNVASSFYYTSAMLGDSQNRIWLDESSMNTFANAKNGTLGTSGRKKIFSYYEISRQYPGESAGHGHGEAGIRSANLFDLDRDL